MTRNTHIDTNPKQVIIVLKTMGPKWHHFLDLRHRRQCEVELCEEFDRLPQSQNRRFEIYYNYGDGEWMRKGFYFQARLIS